MLYTTLNKIRACSPCSEGWEKLLKGLGKTAADDDLLPFERILDINGLDDALWCCRSSPEYSREWRLFAVWCALQVAHLNPDPRVIAAIKAAEDYANSLIDENTLSAARDAAWDAGDAAWDAWDAWAAWAAWAAAGDAAWAAAGDAAWDAARDAAGDAAGDAARDAGDAARDAACAEQKDVFHWIVSGGLSEFERG